MIVGVDAKLLGPRIDETTQTLLIKRCYKHALGQGRPGADKYSTAGHVRYRIQQHLAGDG